MTSPPGFERLVQNLASAGFCEEGLRQLLRVPDPSNCWRPAQASYTYRSERENRPRSSIALFWFLSQPRARAWVEDLTGAELLAWLLEERLVREVGPDLEARVDISPCLGRYFFHDQRLPREVIPDRVYELGSDTYTLARLTPRKPGSRALDLCTGSGIHAILAARDHDHVVGVDLNPKALEFSRLNARVNGVEQRCELLLGDLFEPVAGQTFDLITINPPFVSTPEADMEIHRTGGETGEEISSRTVAELPNYLRPGGTFSMVLSYPIMRDRTYLQRLNGWLGGGAQFADGVPGWGVAVVGTGSLAIESYIAAHSRLDHRPDLGGRVYERYLRSYERLGIVRIGFANVLIRRLAPGHPGFSVQHDVAFPDDDLSVSVEAFLDAQERYADPRWRVDWNGWRPQWSSELGGIWSNRRRDRGRIEPRAGSFAAALDLAEIGHALASSIDGRNTAARLAEIWARRHGLTRAVARSQVKLRLARLGRNLFLEPGTGTVPS